MSNISKLVKSEPNERKEAIKKLEGFLLNPGRFSVLVLGMRGTGKTHWLQKIQKNHAETSHLTGLISVNAALANNCNQDFWLEKFSQANNKLLVVDDVEKLSKENQEILFEGLSTGPGAQFGFSNKEFEFRIVFTSSFHEKTLRDTEEFLLHKFFDRISQLVVKLPSYTDTPNAVWHDFKLTWNKMNFKERNEMPGEELKDWLMMNSNQLHGHFRDLDKIAINWQQFRLLNIEEGKILRLVENDFRDFFHFPEHKSELTDAFYIDSSLDWDGNLRKFRKHFKDWVRIEYGSLKKGEKKAGISYRTMERW